MERRRYRRRHRAEIRQQVSTCTAREVQPSKSISVMERTPNQLIQRIETAPVSAESTPDSTAGVQDHLLLVVKAVVNSTRVLALVDSGASRSFINDQLRLRPPLRFIGAYSSLEMANGETIVSTRIAPRALVSIGKVSCRLALTAVPMMEGVQLIHGKDWLDIQNPLVDWRSNTVFLRNGS